MINTQSVVDRMIASLDAEGSDRYLFQNDFKPAINSAIDWVVAVFNKAFSENKLNEEVLSELVYVRIFQANTFSRVNIGGLSSINHKVWTILGVFPEPTVYPATPPPAQSDPAVSTFRPDLTFVESEYSADKSSIEQWNQNRKNIFRPGNETLQNKFKKYAYLNTVDFSSTGYSGTKEISIRPSVAGKFVGISYLKQPNVVNVITDPIELPDRMMELLFQKALNFISYKQGDRTNLYSVTANDVKVLAQILQ